METLSAKSARGICRMVGGLAFLTAVWEAISLLAGLASHLTAATAWLHAAQNVPLIAIWGVGGAALVRVRVSGFYPLFVVKFLSILFCGFPPMPFLYPWLCIWLEPSPVHALFSISQPISLILLCLLIVARSALWLVGVSGPALTAWDFLWRPGLVVGLVFLFINCCYENEL